jgi:integrase
MWVKHGVEMGYQHNKLSALKIKALVKKGRYSDGNGLYLQVSTTGKKSWILRYGFNGKTREMGLGSTSIVSLKEARQKTMEAKKLLGEGIDPLVQKQMDYNGRIQVHKNQRSFKQCAEEHIALHSQSWRNKKHRDQWVNTLAQFAFPIIGDTPVSKITTEQVLQVLTPIWYSKNETANRLRGRIEAIVDSAIVSGYRKHPNPARWRGHLDRKLPKPSRVQEVQHFKALPIQELPKFLRTLRKRNGIAASALEFTILTACRTNEVLGAQWSEIDLNSRLWVIPKNRMKARREHIVPLSSQAIKILEHLNLGTKSSVFPGRGQGDQLSNMAMLSLLRKMGYPVTVHGFRSTFRDWVAESTNTANEVADMALAHAIKNRTEAAYRRGDLLLKRRVLMQQWADFCDRPTVEPQIFDFKRENHGNLIKQ